MGLGEGAECGYNGQQEGLCVGRNAVCLGCVTANIRLVVTVVLQDGTPGAHGRKGMGELSESLLTTAWGSTRISRLKIYF